MVTLVTSVLGLLSSVPGGRYISAGVVTAVRTEELWNRGSILTRAKIFIFPKVFRPALGPRSPVNWVPRHIVSAVKLSECEAGHSF